MTAGDYTVNPQSAFGDVSTEAFAADKSSGLTYHKSENKIWKIIGVVSIIIALIALGLGSFGFVTAHYLTQAGPVSCLHASKGTGIYFIRTESAFDSFPVYCDMDTDGGGWTLVASIHENDIQGKCTNGDLWSSDQGSTGSSDYNGTKNWENKNIFGTIYSLTNDDYKNLAYYSLKAKNVMIWHVPNQTPLNEISSKAFLKYYTKNDFLVEYGGTLQSLYSKHTPLVHAGPSRFFTLVAPPVVYAKGDNETVLAGIPNSQKMFVQPGFIQFRTFDTRGFPNALCPGVRMITGNSAQVCIGGGGVSTRSINGFNQRINRLECGDFAGWAGQTNDPGSATLPSNTSRSQNDINSSLFIFVR